MHTKGGVRMAQEIFGERLKKRRKGLRITQKELGDAVGVTRQTVIQWEQGNFSPDMDKLSRIAEALACSAAWLLGEIDEPELNQDFGEGAPGPFSENFLRIPLMDKGTAACAGNGFDYCGAYMESTDTIVLPRNSFSRIDAIQIPFGIHVEGDSMEGAGIPDGSIAIINPAETVYPGDATLVCYNDRWSIKWLIPKSNGDVELRSANPSYQPMIIPSELASREEWFRIIGKVVQTVTTKKPTPYF